MAIKNWFFLVFFFYPFTIVNLVSIGQAKSHSVDILSEMPLLLLLLLLLLFIYLFLPCVYTDIDVETQEGAIM